ncbi:hypothetical protein RHAB21_00700 [Pseudorhizobium halotolerans]|uniref:Uncharacterized protein n=1 Tax=Pseudorhizobium halotolerans TaxID=1233081 RepID=A0ABM8PYT6_9HYPH|nr:hypothetical protein [Pseudorhizobium halotolerans]CAD7055343.1 hypothetical protein RHAB21_00700 [Pseudorhizobium halotolerans]
MSRSKRRTRTWKLKLSIEELEKHAPAIFGPLLHLVEEGFVLQTSSGIWRKADGTGTARYVYRCGTNREGRSIVLTSRNIPLRYEAA